MLSPIGISVHTTFNTSIVDTLMASQTENREKRVLLLLDDLGEDVHHSKEAKPIFHKLVANSRHLNISLLWLCQRITQAPTFVRSNTDCFISFASLSTREREALYNEVSMTDKRTFADMFSRATQDQYSTFCAVFKGGKLNYYKDLDEPIV